MMITVLTSWAVLLVAVVAQACSVRTNYGEPVNLSALPIGVTYNEGIWRCLAPNACEEWRFEGCSIINCQATQSCEDATFINNKAVTCWAKEACRYAIFSNSHEVACGYGHADSCDEASIEVDGELLCYGDHACMFHKYVIAGAHGQVQCAAGKGDFVCGNMDISIKHGHRACFGDNADGGCAVVCISESDCDKATITFTVE